MEAVPKTGLTNPGTWRGRELFKSKAQAASVFLCQQDQINDILKVVCSSIAELGIDPQLSSERQAQNKILFCLPGEVPGKPGWVCAAS